MRLISELTRRDLLDIIRDGFSIPAYTQIETADFGWIDTDDGTKEIKMDYWGRLDEISFLQRLYPLDIIDPRYYDYFFNRCLSLIALAIQYLQ